jgi:hypothetical protein
MDRHNRRQLLSHSVLGFAMGTLVWWVRAYIAAPDAGLSAQTVALWNFPVMIMPLACILAIAGV